MGILGAMVGAVAVVTFGLAATIAPAPISIAPTTTPQPTFDLAVAPTAIGGRLEVAGDRTGTLVLDEATGLGGRYSVRDDGLVSIQEAEDVMLRGTDGRISFDRETAAVTQIDFEEMSFYLDPGECVVTQGAVNPTSDLMSGRVECEDIVDIRGNGTVTIAGIVALPAPALRGRGDLPQTGGDLDIGGSVLTFTDLEIFIGGEPQDDGRIHWGDFNEVGGYAVAYDTDADRFYLDYVSIRGMDATPAEPCPIATQELGRIDETTTVVRFEIDCTMLTVAESEPVSVTGTLVADVIEGSVEDASGP
jgi:hypothetical protein